ncbi:unnamed protein product [Cochlearia groenlandica]
MESTELQNMGFFSSFSEPALTTSFNRLEPVSKTPVYSSTAQNGEDDDYVAELTRQMTNYMLQDDEKHQKSCGGGSGSPQSTLWSPFDSGYSSPIGPSREPSPPLTPATTTVETKLPFKSKQALIDNQIRSVQANFLKIKKEKEKQGNDDVLGYKARSYYQQRPRSGVKAVFVDGSGLKAGSGGTGVFLPRGHSTVVESRKKPGCSTVIIPARVVEALKVHFDKLGVPSTFSSSDIPPFHDALLVSMNNKNNKSNKITSSSTIRAQSGPPCMVETSMAETHHEPPADLPHEWTY